ncbi:hypothetical protein BH10PSE4_BH10PSE4_07280 [soil metagenome]
MSVLHGTNKADTLVGGSDDDIYYVDNAGDVVVESPGGGNDLVYVSASWVATAGSPLERIVADSTANLNITGNLFAAEIVGNGAMNTLDDGGGADTLKGASGNDTYMVRNAGTLVVELSGEGYDSVRTTLGQYSLTDNVETLTFAGAGPFFGLGNDLANVIQGGTSNDTLDGGAGVDRLIGGLGDDVYVVDNAADAIVEAIGEGYDTQQTNLTSAKAAANIEALVYIGALNFTGFANATGTAITGGAGADVLRGGIGADVLNGGLGVDQLTGGGGADTLDGGAGTDTAFYSGARARYTVLPDGTGGFYITDSQSGGDGVDHLISIETLQFTDGAVSPLIIAQGATLTGTDAADSIVGGNGADTLDGGLGADTLVGGGGDDVYVIDNAGDVVVEAAGGGLDTVRSTVSLSLAALPDIESVTLLGAANLTATGNAVGNVLTGNDGSNTLDGGAGADTLIGGKGNDTYIVDRVDDVLVELVNQGADTVRTSLSAYTLPDNIDNLTFVGAGPYHGYGNALANLFTGSAGADTLEGGAGNDTYVIINSKTQIIEAAGGGVDSVVATVSYVMADGIENLRMFGTGPNGGRLTGVGNDLANTITGTTTDQVLIGGGGDDTLTGGGGTDEFVFAAGSGHDVITDFNTGAGGDKARLTFDGFTNLAAIQAHMTQLGADVKLSLSAGDDVIFRNTTIASFTTDNFRYSLDTSDLTLAFSDEFNTLVISDGVTGTWQTTYGYRGAGPVSSHTLQATGEKQIYVDASYTGSGTTPLGLDPFSLSGGVLTITAAKTTAATKDLLYGYDYTSGLLTTQPSFAQTYGYFEMRAKMPSGSGAWPAFWLLPTSGSNPPEVDILEVKGADPNSSYLTLHDLALPGTQLQSVAYTPNAASQFHTYGLRWDADYITWFIDGSEVYKTATPADMHQSMYILIDLAVGGAFGGTVDEAALLSTNLQLDYVRAYAINGVTIPDPTVGQSLDASVSSSVTGGLGDDTILGGSGFALPFGMNSDIYGRLGQDKVVYAGPQSQYLVFSDDHGGYFVVDKTSAGGADHLSAVELIGFSDGDQTLAGVSHGIYLQGTRYAERHVGEAQNDLIFGYAGSDTIDGGQGDDTLVGGPGNDAIDGGAGLDTAYFSGVRTQYTIYADDAGGFNITDLGAGSPDGFDHLSNIEFLRFADKTVAATDAAGIYREGSAASETLSGTYGNDTLYGAGGDDSLYGGDRPDLAVYDGPRSQYLVLSDGGDSYYVIDQVGGEGTDRLFDMELLQFSDGVVSIASTVSGLLSVGTADADTMLGSSGGDLLYGLEGDDTAQGGDGNDTFTGGAGADRFEGGAGVDTAVYAGPLSGYDVYAVGADIYVKDLTDAEGLDRLIAVEQLKFSTGVVSAYDVARGVSITGTLLNQTLTGSAGADTIDGGGGRDRMVGGTGGDLYKVDNSRDVVVEAIGEGDDTVVTSVSWTSTAGSQIEHLVAASGTTTINLTASSFAMELVGNSGTNTLNDGGVAATMRGGAGNDTYVVTNAADQVFENAGEGTDTVSTTLAAYGLTANVENLKFTGSGGFQGWGNDLANTITGGAGADTLIGGGGADSLVGGSGSDVFGFADFGLGVDRISGFVSGVDHIGLVASAFGVSSLSDLGFVSSASPVAADNHPTLLYNTRTGALYFDATGGSNADQVQIAILNGKPPLTAHDILLL